MHAVSAAMVGESRVIEIRAATAEQPAPVSNRFPAVWDLVMSEFMERDALGLRRYGVRLQPHNGRDMLRDALEEAMDLVVYLRGAIYERDGA
jgi:hypothetical protein